MDITKLDILACRWSVSIDNLTIVMVLIDMILCLQWDSIGARVRVLPASEIVRDSATGCRVFPEKCPMAECTLCSWTRCPLYKCKLVFLVFWLYDINWCCCSPCFLQEHVMKSTRCLISAIPTPVPFWVNNRRRTCLQRMYDRLCRIEDGLKRLFLVCGLIQVYTDTRRECPPKLPCSQCGEQLERRLGKIVKVQAKLSTNGKLVRTKFPILSIRNVHI